MVYPWGVGRCVELAEESETEETLALGDLVALDVDHIGARIAYARYGLRGAAEVALARWALADDWQLEVEPGIHPLAELTRPVQCHPRSGVCRDCGETLGTGFVSSLGFAREGFIRTRCSLCGGRRVWHSMV